MHSRHLFAPASGFARVARAWLLWIALGLAAAHSLAVWHGYTHSTGEASDAAAKQQAGTAHCALCLAAADIAGAAPCAPMVLQHGPRTAPLIPVAYALRLIAQRRPYAIRAPPTLMP